MIRIPVTRDLEIRSFLPTDAENLARHLNNLNVWRTLRDSIPHPYCLDDARQWIAFATGQSPQTHFAIAQGKETVGGIGIRLNQDIHRYSGEIGYWLGEPFWGRGIMTQVVRVFTQWAFRELGLVRIYAEVFENNPASARVLEKVGYTCEGRLRYFVYKQGHFLDVLLYARIDTVNAARLENRKQ